MSLWQKIALRIAEESGEPFKLQGEHAIGGGCINSASRLKGESSSWFVKTNSADRLPMFEAEAAGLDELVASNTVHVPKPLCTGIESGSAYIVMENIEMGRDGRDSMARFGRELAAMHHTTQDRFGWYRDNTIGATHQPNSEMESWIEFYRDRRLGYQIDLAARKGAHALSEKGERLMAGLDAFFNDYTPQPSLLHGDLWSGNYAIDSHGVPVIFDPAVYFGDREADLAMSELFGSFGPTFYDAYHEAWPIDPGYSVRKTLYNLYHIINHFNMFGSGYLGQAESMVEQLLSEL
ncbi:hypothetical protein BOW53_00060 [Solemya pervernicosa gill symbiont]|uniref:Fructosamine kinase family protein n=1 Tax=Solemya pervernicosa gill symbiont TaxID=642797 RepID=A0A1T2LAZ9_9GAMM|nr:fructosamine kinase family protein [Solemya pervernicosa gill symbiont]OOZ42275.1 hypothetical protein BOW53_00060 [Solemya pervernicosa gill symbiont]